jgi:glucose/arabinose dehydrogenase
MRPLILAIGILLSLDRSAAEAQLRTQTVVTGLSAAVAFVADPAQPGVAYAVQQNGLVVAIQGTTALAAPFLDMRSAISTGGERGLLGMAFAPDPASGRVFVNFTNPNGDTVIARFRRSTTNPLTVDPSSRFDLRWPNGNRFITQPFANHNGGNLAFGSDGDLYIGLGDGGSGNDPNNNAQNPNSLLGKMLRIDVSVADSDPAGYRIPADNPFVRGTPIAALGEIWAFGLRNPWRYSFDNAGLGGTGALFIGDVGQDTREEIDAALAGRGGQNYGWRVREGTIATPGIGASAPAYTPLTEPLIDYGHSLGSAVTGGYVYRGRALGSEYFGRYFLADSGSGRLWSVAWQLDPATGRATVTGSVDHSAEIGAVGSIVSFAEDASGELYLVLYSGRIVKLVGSGAAPSAPGNLTSQTTGRAVQLTWTGVSGATQYRIEAGSRSGAAELAIIDTGSGQESFTANGVGDGVYYVRVKALAGVTASAASNEVVIAIGATPCTAPPPAPAGFTATASGSVASLSWTASGTLTSIVLEAGASSGASNAAVVVLAPTARTFLSSAPAGAYYVRVRAVNACGASAASNELILRIPG